MSSKISNKPTKSVVVGQEVSALHKFLILDSQFETLYDSITRLAAKACEVPVALITFVDDERIWVKSEVGFSYIGDVPRQELFCGIVASSNEYLEINDIADDEMHRAKAPEVDGQKFRFYAGAPVKLPLGEMIGVVCVYDTKPRQLTELQREILLGLADILTKALVTKNFLSRIVN